MNGWQYGSRKYLISGGHPKGSSSDPKYSFSAGDRLSVLEYVEDGKVNLVAIHIYSEYDFLSHMLLKYRLIGHGYMLDAETFTWKRE